MNRMQECSKSQAPGTGVIGTSGRIRPLPSAGKRLLAAGLLLSCASIVNAALIEMPHLRSDRNYSNEAARHHPLSPQTGTRDMRLGKPGADPATARLFYPANDTLRMHYTGAHVLRTANGGPSADSDLYAAIDAPYGAIDATTALAEDSGPELWTILLIAAGLIGYQLRRKSKFGAIRVRPLQF
jgi:hypothetical protein